MLAAWPEPQEKWEDAAALAEMHTVMEGIRSIRNLRAEAQVPPGKPADVLIQAEAPAIRELLGQNTGYIKTLAKVADLTMAADRLPPVKQSSTAVLSFAEIHLCLEGLIDVAKETQRLEKELAKVEKEIGQGADKLKNEAFTSKAPPAVIEKEKEKLAAALTKKEGICQRLQALKP
jgi:valyl-tRNA synthetase